MWFNFEEFIPSKMVDWMAYAGAEWDLKCIISKESAVKSLWMKKKAISL